MIAFTSPPKAAITVTMMCVLGPLSAIALAPAAVGQTPDNAPVMRYREEPPWPAPSIVQTIDRFPPDSRCVLAAERRQQLEAMARPALALRLPELDGQPTQARLARWAETRLSTFLARARASIVRLDRAAREIAEFGCVSETVAVLSLHGMAYERFHSELQRIPEPLDVEPHLGCRNDSWLIPLRSQAVDSYQACLDLARTHRAFDEAALACAEGLERLDQLAPSHEFVPSRRWVDADPALPPAQALLR